MTDKPRVEAVARALAPMAWEILDRCKEGSSTHMQIQPEIYKSVETAKKAIEANDAWLKSQHNLGKHIYVATLGLTNDDTSPEEIDR